MHFIDQYKELYPDPKPEVPEVPVEELTTVVKTKPLAKPAVLPHATPVTKPTK